MLKIIKYLFLTVVVGLNFIGCTSSGYSEFYKPYNASNIERYKQDPNFEFLKKGEEPKIFTSNNLAEDIKVFRRKRLHPIGFSSFNGSMESENEVLAQAKKIESVVALYTWKYTNTQTNSGVLLMPQTNYHSGSVYGANSYATYSGTSMGTSAIPYSNTQRRFDQEAVYFIRSLHKLKFGFALLDIDRNQKIALGKSGVIVEIIFEDTPAHYSNLLEGDVITKLNQIEIQNVEHINKLLMNYDISNGVANLSVIRNGEERIINILFNGRGK